MSETFRYDAVGARVGLRDRLRGVGASPRLVVGGTVAALLVVVPVIVVVGLLVAGTLWDDGGAVALLGMLLAGGAFAVASVLHEGGKGGVLERFAHANGLHHVRATAAPDYAGSLFADGSTVVDQSVRTRDHAFAEVGDRFQIRAPRARYDSWTGRVHADAPQEPRLFLRARLAGRVASPEAVTLDDDLDDRLTRFAGEHVVELARDELTVYGSRRLDADRAGRLEEAFALLEALVARTDARLPRTATSSAPTPTGDPRPRRAWGPLRVVGLTLALLVVVPLGFAFVMSIVDDLTDSRAVAVLSVNLLIAVSGAAIALLLRRSTAGTADDGTTGRRRWWPWLVGAVAFVALGVVAVNLDQDTDVNDDDDKQSAAECYADDPWCQQDVSTRVWARSHGLSRSGELDWQSCVRDVGTGRTTCPVRVDCAGGHADLVTELAGEPLEVVGARAASGPTDQALLRTHDEVDRLVGQECRPS